MQERKNPRAELTELKLVLKQLEGVYRTTSDPGQRKRVSREMRRIREQIRQLKLIVSLHSGFDASGHPLTGADTGDASLSVPAGEKTKPGDGYTILDIIQVERFNKHFNDQEMDAVISYAQYFESNYLPILSEYYVKLDYNHSLRRDAFYPRYMEVKKVLKEYEYEVEVRSNDQYNSIATMKDKSAVHKVRYRYLLALNEFFKELRAFLRILTEDVLREGTILLNPEGVITMSEYESDRRLDNRTVAEALDEVLLFTEEMIRFLGMPKIKSSLEGDGTQWHR